MTRQEKLLLEYSKFQKPIHREISFLDEVRRFGIVGLYDIQGRIVTEQQLDDYDKRALEKLIQECRYNKRVFKNAWLVINYYTRDRIIVLYNQSYIQKGVFNNTVELRVKSGIENGTFNDYVILKDSSFIKDGVFNNKVFLNNYSYIKGGYFNTIDIAPYTWQDEHNTIKWLKDNKDKYEHLKYDGNVHLELRRLVK